MGFNQGFVGPGEDLDSEVAGAETQVDTSESPERLKSYGAQVKLGDAIDLTASYAATESASEP